MSTMTGEDKKQLAHWCNKAYQRELRTELEKLKLSFDEWESGAMSSFQLCSIMRSFGENIADELYRKYVMTGQHRSALNGALKRGVVSEEELPPELLTILRN